MLPCTRTTKFPFPGLVGLIETVTAVPSFFFLLRRAASILAALVLNAPHDLHASIVTVRGAARKDNEEVAAPTFSSARGAALAFLLLPWRVLGGARLVLAGGFFRSTAGDDLLLLAAAAGRAASFFSALVFFEEADKDGGGGAGCEPSPPGRPLRRPRDGAVDVDAVFTMRSVPVQSYQGNKQDNGKL
jgi:hypothetical protein